MRTNFTIIVIVIISNQFLFSQNLDYKYYNQSRVCVPNTDSLYNNGKYWESIIYNLKRTDSIGNRIPQANYIIAQDYALLGMEDSAFNYLNRYIDFGSRDYRSVYIDEDFEILRKNKKEWNAIIARIENYYLMELDSSMNSELALELFNIGVEENRVWLTVVSCRRKNLPTREERRDHNLNSQKKIKKIIKKHGLPTPSMVGKTAAGIAWSIIQHSTIKDKHYYMIKDAYEKGDYNPEHYALTTDRWLTQNGKKQIYGTQFTKTQEEDVFTIMEVEDFNNINNRRAELGLPSIEEYAKYLNGVIPKEYYNEIENH
jgi:hypothetical protein